MSSSGLVRVKELLKRGFFYNNLIEMVKACQEENHIDHLITAFILSHLFYELANMMEAQPYESTQQELESKYKGLIEQTIQETLNSSPKQFEILQNLIKIYWSK